MKYCYLLLLSITCSFFSCKEIGSKELTDKAIKEIRTNNRNNIKEGKFSEEAKQIIEWFDDDIRLKSRYPSLHTVETTKELNKLLDNNPETIKALYLDAGDSEIEINDLSIFKNLEYLKLRYIDSLPIGFYQLKELKIFDSVQGLKCSMDKRITNLSNLEMLILRYVDLKLPKEISTLKKLTTLKLYSFKDNQPYKSIYKIPNLKTLGIRYTHKHQLKGISQLTKLKALKTNKVSSEIGKLNLSGLYILGSNDEKYPIELGKLENLIALRWGTNSVRKTPPEFVSLLKNIEYLEIRGCTKMESIPISINNLVNLKQFDILCRPKFTGRINHLTNIKEIINIR